MPKATKKEAKISTSPKAKTIKKEVKVTKSVDKKKRATAKDIAGKQYLDLGLLLDCTGSMTSWIARAKDTLSKIIDNVKASVENQIIIRVAFIGYRDHQYGEKRLIVKGFTDDVEEMKKFISNVDALYTSGNDPPEDVTGGLRACLDQDWSLVSKKQVFHIFDAPCHGNKYHSIGRDCYPDGCPKGLILEDLMKEFASRNISFTAIKLNDYTNTMIKFMEKAHPEMQITDLASAEKTKSAAEVT